MTKSRSSIAQAWLGRRKGSAPATVARNRLDIILPFGWPQSLDAVAWHWHHQGKRESGTAHELDQIPAGARASTTCVWTPSADTMLTEATIPSRSPRKIAQALPYALEDRLLGEPEALHFAWRPIGNGRLAVAVTNKARFQDWTERLKRAGLKPTTMCPTTLLVPWAMDCWSMAFVGPEILVRTGPVSGFVCPQDSDQPPALLAAAMREAQKNPNPPEALVTFQAPRGFAANRWSELIGAPIRVENGTLWDHLDNPAAPIDLQQGQFEQSVAIGESLKPFIPAGIMLGVWLASSVLFDFTDWWRLKREYDNVRKEMTNIVRTNFPEIKTILDPAAQMQRAVDKLIAQAGRDDRDIVLMLNKVATAMRGTTNAHLRSLRYSDSTLTVEIAWPAPGATDAFRAAVESAGLKADVLSVTPRANEVDGRFRLSPKERTTGGNK